MTLSQIAAKYIGQRELPNNVFDDKTDFGHKIHLAGQVNGDAWCDLFVEVCCKETWPDRAKEFDKLFTKNANATRNRFMDAKHSLSNVPVVDWVATWIYMKDGQPVSAAPGIFKGHTGIVSAVHGTDKFSFESIEGNTGDATGREGDVVAKKWHRVDSQVNSGLKVVGFYKP